MANKEPFLSIMNVEPFPETKTEEDSPSDSAAEEEPFVSVIDVEPSSVYPESEDEGTEGAERDGRLANGDTGQNGDKNSGSAVDMDPTGAPLLRCPRCPYETRRRPCYVRHLRRHLRQDALSLPCPHCDAKYLDSVSLERHVALHRGTGPAPALPCTFCGTSFTKAEALQEHLALHAQENKRYKCSVCQESFIAYKEMASHKAQHQRSPTHVCKVCGKGYMQSESLRCHMARHTGSRDFACTVCSKRYLTWTVLKKHLLTHTGERPHQCTTCGLRFTLRCHLIAHKRTHTGERPFRCTAEGCPEAFTTSSAAKRHLLRIHLQPKKRKSTAKGEASSPKTIEKGQDLSAPKADGMQKIGDTPGQEPESEPPVPRGESGGTGADSTKAGCIRADDTGTADTRADELDHEVAGMLAELEGNRGPPYQCPKCSATFPTLSGVWGHASIHVGPRCYPCPLCTKAFASIPALKRHTQRVHKVHYTQLVSGRDEVVVPT